MKCLLSTEQQRIGDGTLPPAQGTETQEAGLFQNVLGRKASILEIRNSGRNHEAFVIPTAKILG